MAAVEARARSLGVTPTVACVEWIDPLMAAGNWMPELVSMAGGDNLFGSAGHHSPWMSFEDLQAADPDVIAVLPCGFDRVRTRAEMGPLTERRDWAELSAVKAGRVYVTDGNQYFNRPGPPPRRVPRDDGRDAAHRRLRFRAPGCRLGKILAPGARKNRGNRLIHIKEYEAWRVRLRA